MTRIRMTTSMACVMIVMIGVPEASRADLIYGNFDSNTEFDGSIGFLDNQPTVEYEAAHQFTAPVSFALEAVVVPVHTVSDGEWPPVPPGTLWGDSMQAAIYADAGGVPGALLELIDAPNTLEEWTTGEALPPPVTVGFSGTTVLQAGQSYWLGLIETEGTALFWARSSSLTPHPRMARFAGGSQWGSSNQVYGGFQLHGTVVPAPACVAMLLWPLVMRGRRRKD